MAETEIDAAIKVAGARGIGSRRAARLFAALGSFRAISTAGPKRLAENLHCSETLAARIDRSMRGVSPGKLLRSARDIGAFAIPRGDDDYPRLLDEICDPPPVLWARGERGLLGSPGVALVGTRRCSVSAPEVVGMFATTLGQAGFTIVSGGARGVDAAAHRAALQENIPTIAVLGSGLDQPYPPEHTGLFDDIVAAGGVVISEYACGVGPRPGQFPARNRIVAGMTLGVLVHEAGIRSGALITARLAAEDYGREVMVVPGSVLNQLSEGSHRAVREGWAVLVDRPEHAIEQLLESKGLILALQEGLESGIGVKTRLVPADEEDG